MVALVQLRHALLRLGEVLRTETWRSDASIRLHPSQARMLRLLASSPDGFNVGAIAHDIGIRQPTVSRAVNTLVRKGLVEKAAQRGRAVSVRLSSLGRDWIARSEDRGSALDEAIEALSPQEQASLLASATKMIRTLQVSGAIAPQRLCVTCAYFQPNQHSDPNARHHCTMVGAAFGDRELKLDCPEHHPASPDQADQAWSMWQKESAAPPAVTGETALFATHPQVQTGA